MSIKTPRSIPSILCLLIGSMGLGASACRDEIQGSEFAEFDEYRCFLVDPQLP